MLAAVHLRTGWADWTHRNAKHGWDALGECAEFRTIPAYAGATREGLGIVDNDGKHSLPKMLEMLANAADSAFGTKKWELFTSSDSPAVRAFVGDKLKNRAAAVHKSKGIVGR